MSVFLDKRIGQCFGICMGSDARFQAFLLDKYSYSAFNRRTACTGPVVVLG